MQSALPQNKVQHRDLGAGSAVTAGVNTATLKLQVQSLLLRPGQKNLFPKERGVFVKTQVILSAFQKEPWTI